MLYEVITITNAATWSENKTYATISSSGLLTVSEISSRDTLLLSASYQGKSYKLNITVRNQITYILYNTSRVYGDWGYGWDSSEAYIRFFAKSIPDLSITDPDTYLSIDLMCQDPENLNYVIHDGEIEITSSGTWDNQEWAYRYFGSGSTLKIDMTNYWKTFLIPITQFSDRGLNVNAINFIRVYAYFTSNGRISWRNAKIIMYS